jgi:hypothetical protein
MFVVAQKNDGKTLIGIPPESRSKGKGMSTMA